MKLFEHKDFEQAILGAVQHFRESGEYAAIKRDYDAISREYFPKSYFYPEAMSFAKSDALFPPADLAKIISVEYEEQCKILCYGPYPSWEEVQAKLLGTRDLLYTVSMICPDQYPNNHGGF